MANIIEVLFTNILCVVIVSVGLLLAYSKYIMRVWKRKNIPYFEPTLLFGNRSALGKTTLSDDVFKLVEKAKGRGWRYFGVFLGVKPYFVPLDTNLTKCILAKDFNHFTERGWYYNEEDDPISAHMGALGGDKWKKLRMKVSPTFTSKKLKEMFQTLLNCALNLENYLMESYNNGPLEFKKIFACLTADIIISCGFGVDSNSFIEPDPDFLKYGRKYFLRDTFTGLKKDFLNTFPNLAKTLHLRRIPEDVSKFFYEIVSTNISFRKKNNISRKDFLQLLIDMGEGTDQKDLENGLTIDQIVAQCAMFFLAGFESSSNTLTFALYELAINADIQEKARNEIFNVLEKYNGQICYDSINEFHFLHQVIDETLRKYTPTPYITRECDKDYKIPDTEIILEKGTPVIIPLRNIHHDEENYENPDKFDPERFSPENKLTRNPFTFMPFGEGPRICLGLRLSTFQTIIGLTTVLKNFHVSLNSKTEMPLNLDSQFFIAVPKGAWFNLRKLQKREFAYK